MTDVTALSGAYRTLPDMIGKVEPRICQVIRDEPTDQRASLKLVVSENYVSLPVLVTMGTWPSDKYAEGTTGHRFYAGCQNVGIVELVAAEYVRKLLGAEYAYTQPHSEIDVNLTTYWAILAHHIGTPALAEFGSRNVSEPSEADWETLRARSGSQRLLGMNLDMSGHLTHGSRPNTSGEMFHQRSYDTNSIVGLLDYDALAAQAAELKPLVVVAGCSAYPRRIDFAKVREIADSVGVVLTVDMAHFVGLVVDKVFTGNENLVPFAQAVIIITHKSLRSPCGDLVLATRDYAGDVDRDCLMVLDGPLSHITVAKAVALVEARTEASRDYAHRVVDNVRALAEGLLKRGGILVTGGTDNHVVLLDVSSLGLTGRQAGSALLDSSIVTNRNLVPNDPNGAWHASGIRLDTSALTSRGFTTSDMDEVAVMTTDVLKKITPITTKDGKSGKAKYELAQEVADGSENRAAKPLDLHPLYLGLAL